MGPGFESLKVHQNPAERNSVRLDFFIATYAGARGEASKHACAGRRSLPTTKQRSPAVFRARHIASDIIIQSAFLNINIFELHQFIYCK